MDSGRTAERWWVPPVLRLAAAFAALAIAAATIWLLLRHADLPSAESLLSDYGYLGVAVGAYADSFGLPSSGEIVLLAAAAAAAKSTHFNIGGVILVAWLFAWLGDLSAYGIGRAAGPGVLRRFGVTEDNAVHGFMERHGVRAVAAGRLVAGIRTKLAIVSGSTKMSFFKYAIADAIGAAVWAVLVGGIGYLFANSVNMLITRFDSASHVIAVVGGTIVAVVVAYLCWRYVRGFRPKPEADASASARPGRTEARPHG
jgi:membrane protein DedA with SNARE-associated domain